MGHPFIVNYLKENHTLNLTDLLCIRKLRFLGLIELNRLLLENMLKLILFHIPDLVRQFKRLERNNRKQQLVDLLEIPLLGRLVVADIHVNSALHNVGQHFHHDVSHVLSV